MKTTRPRRPRRAARVVIVGVLCVAALTGLLVVLLHPLVVVKRAPAHPSVQVLTIAPADSPTRDPFVAEPTPRVTAPAHPPLALPSRSTPRGRASQPPSSRPHSSVKPRPQSPPRPSSTTSTPTPKPATSGTTRQPILCLLGLCVSR